MNPYKSFLLVLVLVFVAQGTVASGQTFSRSSFLSSDLNQQQPGFSHSQQARAGLYRSPVIALQPDTSTQADSEYPDPKSVLYKSLMIPGWGQLINNQAWKIPIVYALIGGVAAYNIYLTRQYHDYRAAFYNATHDDMKFGPTPDYIPPDTPQLELKSTRNRLRNRRDFTYIGIALAYGLNVLDAYVYAHMRSFDVSEDLSLKADIRPAIMADASPGVTLSLRLFNNKK